MFPPNRNHSRIPLSPSWSLCCPWAFAPSPHLPLSRAPCPLILSHLLPCPSSVPSTPYSEFGSRGFSTLGHPPLAGTRLPAPPTQFPAEDTADLLFISDADLRANLRSDLVAMDRALSNGEWKAATVLAGSVLDALLLWALNQAAPPGRIGDQVRGAGGSPDVQELVQGPPEGGLHLG